jgi:hypothetical protein
LDIQAALAISDDVKSIVNRAAFIAIACGLAACSSAGDLMAKTAPAGTSFNQNGKVTLHRGQPCTSQIMFDFHPAGSKTVIWLAAGAHESNRLTAAAEHHNRVRVGGSWKRGRQTGCGYVDVTSVTEEKSWLGNLFKP